MLDELRNVLTPIAQRRYGDGKHVEPVVQVATETTLTDFLGQVAIGRRNDADVDVDGARAAEPFDLALLQHAEQLGLELERQLPDLVEEDRSAVGELETANLRRMRARKRAALAPEELALHQVRRQRRTVDDDERAIATRAALMNGSREQLLARAGFAGQEHGRIGRRHLVDAEHDVPQGVAVADDRVAVIGSRHRDRSRNRTVAAPKRGHASKLAFLGNGWKRHDTLTRFRKPTLERCGGPTAMPGGWRGADGPAADRRGESAGRRTAILHEDSWVEGLDYGKSQVGSPAVVGSVGFR